MGFCNAAKEQYQSSTSSDTNGGQNEGRNDDSLDESAFVTEPPLGLRPDLIEENYGDETQPQYEEYDEARCEVKSGFV